jgi:hypothetical protein
MNKRDAVDAEYEIINEDKEKKLGPNEVNSEDYFTEGETVNISEQERSNGKSGKFDPSKLTPEDLKKYGVDNSDRPSETPGGKEAEKAAMLFQMNEINRKFGGDGGTAGEYNPDQHRDGIKKDINIDEQLGLDKDEVNEIFNSSSGDSSKMAIICKGRTIESITEQISNSMGFLVKLNKREQPSGTKYCDNNVYYVTAHFDWMNHGEVQKKCPFINSYRVIEEKDEEGTVFNFYLFTKSAIDETGIV